MLPAIKKAVFPVAGLGTRFLPATKATPKEMLPVVDTPLIEYAIQEALQAGCTEMIFVTSSSKRAIEDHFDVNFELEHKLQEREQYELLSKVRNILPPGVSCAYVRQPEALGLGHAVWCAKPLIGQEPFAVILADDLLYTPPSQPNVLQQMVHVYQETVGSVVAIEPVAPTQVHQYGIIDGNLMKERLYQLKHIIEKPKVSEAPSHLAVVGRYLLTPEIFNYIDPLHPGKNGEIQLTDALGKMMQDHPMFAWHMDAKRFDCGNKLGYLQATLFYATIHPEIGQSFSAYLQTFVEHLNAEIG